jgi:hypothetical protein
MHALPEASSRYGASMGKAIAAELDSFVAAYIEAALWSSTDDDGEPLDSGAYDLADETREAMTADCEAFLNEWASTIEAADLSIEQAGHDFWLSRNGHGAGFFDRGLGDFGDMLQEAAQKAGEIDLYVGDDGLIHQS